MIYLGVPVSDHHLKKEGMQCLNTKMTKKLDPWRVN